MFSIKNRFRVACLSCLVIAGAIVCESADGRGAGRGGGFGGGGYRGGFPATGNAPRGGMTRGYYAQSGFTRGQVANTYGAMGYFPGALTTPGYGYGVGWPSYGGYGYYPGWGSGYYYGQNYNYNYNYNPSEYLQGAADVYNAQGNFLVKQAEAQKISAEAKAAQLENQRKAFDQALYEREHTPTAAEIREMELENAFRRSLADPPLSLIVSGQALNDLLVGLARKIDPGKPPPEVPLDQSMLRQVGVTSGAQRTNAGMLQDGGKVDWPILLQGPEQKKLDTLLPQAVGQVTSKGMVDPKLMDQIHEDLDQLTDRLDRQVNSGDITPNQHIQANRFLNNLKTALRALKQPNAQDYFNGKIAAKGATVPQLVQYMSQNNLRFAPALPGQDDAYVDLHRAMVAQAVQADDAGAANPAGGFRIRLGPMMEEKAEAGAKQ
jgi:hypothetical protein